MKTLKEDISDFIGTHECIISKEMKERDDDIKISFTTWGHRAGCRAVSEIIELLDESSKLKVVNMIKNKRVR